MSLPVSYHFSAKLWLYPGKAGWWFVSLPTGLSEEIRSTTQHLEGGWGRLHVSAQVGDTTWRTAIWYDTKRVTYLLPIKAHVRKQQGLESGQCVHVMFWI